VTEAELLAEVTALCDRLGLLWHHDPDSRRTEGSAGFPDLVIAGPRGVLFRELKSAAGDTSAEQDLWGWTLTCLHHHLWRIWRPADWRLGAIRTELAALT